jgi:hypothetical protein
MLSSSTTQSSATTTPSPSAARLEALRKQFDKTDFFELTEPHVGSDFFNMDMIEKKFKEIDDEKNPIAAMIFLRELYKNLELCTMGIAHLMRISVPLEFTKVSAEYQRVQAACETVITFPMTICKIVNVDRFSIAFPTNCYGQTESEKIFKKNIFTRFINLDTVATELFNTSKGYNKEEIIKLCNGMYLKALDNVLFIQEELLSILKAQSSNNNRIERHIKKSKKSILAQHYDMLSKYIDDHQHNNCVSDEISARINYLSTTAANKEEKTEFCDLLFKVIFCEIYALDAIRVLHKSITGVGTFIYLSDKPDLEYLARFYPLVGKDKTEAEMKHQIEYFSALINKDNLRNTYDDLSVLDKDNLTRHMIIFERGILNHIITLSMMMHQIKNNQTPEELPTPRINDLINCLRKKKKLEDTSPSSTSSNSASASSTSSSSSSSSNSSKSEDETKDKVVTRSDVVSRLNYLKTSNEELESLFLHIFKNDALLIIAKRNDDDKVRLTQLENRMINELYPLYEKLKLALTESTADYALIFQKLEIAINAVRNEISLLHDYVKHLESLAEKAAKISKTEQVRLTLERKAQEKAREAKLEEQKRFEAKSEKPVKKFKRQAPPAESKPLPLVKPIKLASRPTTDDKQPQLNEIRLLHLDEACKNIMFIRLILGVNDLDKDVKHYALFYNIFRCFQSLKLYQVTGGMNNTFNPDEVVNLRNMIMHHGINAVCEESVEYFAATIVGNLPQALSDLRRNDLFRKKLDSNSRQTFIQEFGLLERGAMPYVSSFNHARLVIDNTPLYTKLKKFHEAKTDNESTVEYTQVVTNSYMPLMKKIITRMDKMTPQQRAINVNLFINNYFFELQALRMLAIICGELINNNLSTNNAFDEFRQYCRYSVRNVAGHALVDMETPLGFFNALKLKLDRLDEKQASLVTQAPAAFFTPQVSDEKKPQEDLSLQALKLN